jgi:hypothetical protein
METKLNAVLDCRSTDCKSALAGVTFTYAELKFGLGAGLGVGGVMQAGVARDEVGKTHFVSASKSLFVGKDGYNPRLMAGASVTLTGNWTQSFKRETFMGLLWGDQWSVSGQFGVGPGISFGFGDMEFTLGAGLGIGGSLSVLSTEIIESISVTHNQAEEINSLSKSQDNWGVYDVKKNGENDYTAKVFTGSGKMKVNSNIEVFSTDQKVWMTKEYYQESMKAEGWDK